MARLLDLYCEGAGLAQAIPPAYTAFIGAQLLEAIDTREASSLTA